MLEVHVKFFCFFFAMLSVTDEGKIIFSEPRPHESDIVRAIIEHVRDLLFLNYRLGSHGSHFSSCTDKDCGLLFLVSNSPFGLWSRGVAVDIGLSAGSMIPWVRVLCSMRHDFPSHWHLSRSSVRRREVGASLLCSLRRQNLHGPLHLRMGSHGSLHVDSSVVSVLHVARA